MRGFETQFTSPSIKYPSTGGQNFVSYGGLSVYIGAKIPVLEYTCQIRPRENSPALACLGLRRLKAWSSMVDLSERLNTGTPYSSTSTVAYTYGYRYGTVLVCAVPYSAA